MRNCSSTEASPFPSPSSAGTETRNDDTTSNDQTKKMVRKGNVSEDGSSMFTKKKFIDSCLSMFHYYNNILTLCDLCLPTCFNIIMLDLCFCWILVKHCNIFRPNMAHHWHAGSKPLSFTQQKVVVYSCPEHKISYFVGFLLLLKPNCCWFLLIVFCFYTQFLFPSWPNDFPMGEPPCFSPQMGMSASISPGPGSRAEFACISTITSALVVRFGWATDINWHVWPTNT